MNSLIRKWGEQVMRSRQYAAGLALVIAFLSFFDLPIGWLSTVIIALVTLQNGPRHGLMVGAWAILPAVALLCLGQYAIFINIVLLHFLMVWGFACILRKNNSWINVLQLASALGIVSVVAIYFFAPDLQSWLVTQLTAMAREYKNINVFNFQPAEIDLWIKYIGVFATGLLALATILTNLLTLFLARVWQSIVVPMVNIQKECFAVRIHYSVSLLLVALAAGLFLNNPLFVNVLIVALVPFILSGLSLLHAYSATKKNGSVIMLVFYIVFIFLSPYLMMLLSLMSWLDSFINFRKRFVVNNAIIEE